MLPLARLTLWVAMRARGASPSPRPSPTGEGAAAIRLSPPPRERAGLRGARKRPLPAAVLAILFASHPTVAQVTFPPGSPLAHETAASAASTGNPDPAPAAGAPVTHFNTGVAAGGRMALTLSVGGGRVVTLAQPATSLFAADPKVAEVRPASPTSLFIFGIAPGHTTIAALGAGGAPVAQIDLTVRPSSFGSGQVAGLVRGGLHFPGIDIQATPGGYTVTGHARTPGDAERVLGTLRPFLSPGQAIDNRLTVDTPLTVNLQVRVVEVARSVTRQLGINWGSAFNDGTLLNSAASVATGGLFGAGAGVLSGATSTATGFAANGLITNRLIDATNIPDSFSFGTAGRNGSLKAVVDALAEDQLATILAEPNLTAQSGETASFLAGGEYPIPIAQQNNTISVEYKQYGISLAFVPTVISADRISLKVRPEVSQLTTQGAVAISNGSLTLSIPALTVRRAETTVELGSGQSFAIAGMLLDSSTQNARGLPFLGELPILGPLFRSTAYQRGQTELVIIVTPYLVRPVSDPTRLVVPSKGVVLSNDLDRILYDRQLARGTGLPPTVHIPLDVGFIGP